MTNKRVYLAGPYSHADEKVREERAHALSAKTVELMMEGYVVFSPITHGHALLPWLPFSCRTWEFWGAQDRVHLETCQELHVLCLPGWETSRGVTDELAWARESGKPVVYHSA